MTDSKQELQTLKEIALAETNKFVADVEVVVKHLREGVSFEVATTIIESYWGNSAKTKELKLQLNSMDRSANGRVILHTNIDKEDVLRIMGDRKAVEDYFTAVHAFIDDRIETVLNGLKRTNFTEAELVSYNTFRKEVVRYLDYINNYFYDIQPILEKDEITCWTQLATKTGRSEDGDYLFFDSFKEELKREQKYFVETHVNLDKASDYYSLSSCECFAKRLDSQVKLPYLFACWLDKEFVSND